MDSFDSSKEKEKKDKKKKKKSEMIACIKGNSALCLGPSNQQNV